MLSEIFKDRGRLARRVALLAAGGWVTLVRIAAPAPTLAADPAPASPATSAVAHPLTLKDVRPVLEASCAKCHNAKKHKGDVDLSVFTDDKSIARGRKVWRKAAEQVESGDMPPESEKPLADGERAQLLGWLKQASTAEYINPADRDPGPAPIHRLNRAEYNNTVRDLVGIEFDAGNTVGMGDDQPAAGYATLVNALTLPPALLEKYFAAADGILDRVFGYADGSPFQFKDDRAKRQAEQAKAAILAGEEPASVLPSDKDRRQSRGTPGGAAGPTAATPTDAPGKRDAARKVIEPFATRAFRRPVEPGEVERLLALFDAVQAKGDTFESGVRLMLKAVLVSPKFLYRVEQDRAPQGSDQPYRISDYELATRLSYFLWSTMPDRPLLDLAAQGKLSDPLALEQQVKRMLADPRAKALTDNFAAQWLQLGKVAAARPSTEFFPTFTNDVRKAMAEETATFFDHLRTEDRSVLELLDADYTYLNEDLAKHYGIDGVKGKEMRRVALKPEYHRGGLLGMGSVMALTSHTYRTSPTLRGKYVLEVIFGQPPPPPPPDAGMFKDEKKAKDVKSFRELLAQHAADAKCAACHKRIDPLGFGLENFDAVGRWRADAGGRPLDNTGKLVSGETFTGSDELKQIVLKRKGEFVRNLVEQVMTYALGRELDYYDDVSVRNTLTALDKDGYRFSTLVAGVVKGYPFQNRRNAE